MATRASPHRAATRSSTCTSAARWRSVSTVALTGRDDLSLAYTPGVARVCEAIAADPSLTQHYTWVPNTVAVVTDGTAVLGLGDIGPAAAMPVMEGKAVLFKQFGGVDAVPICLDTTDVEEIIETVVRLAPSFGGINLEDISAPALLRDRGPAQGAARHPGLPRRPARHRRRGARRAQERAAAHRPHRRGAPAWSSPAPAPPASRSPRSCSRPASSDIAVTDRQGVLHSRRADLTPVKQALAGDTADRTGRSGTLADALAGADVYIGVSGGTVPEEVVATMAADAIIFALANPHPEVHPDVAHRHARVVATGRSDFPNQINNVLAFPGIFRGAFDVHATGDHRGHEARRRRRAGRAGRRRPARGLGHPLAVRPAGRPRGRRRGRRGRPARRGRPPLSARSQPR